MLTCEIWCTYITNYILHCDITFSFYRGSCDLWGSVVGRIRMRIRFDPYNFEKPDAEPDSNQSQMSLVVTEGTGSESKSKAGTGSAFIWKFRSRGGSKWSYGRLRTFTMKAWRLKIEARRLKMKPLRVCGSVVPDLHHFDKDPDPWPDLDLNRR